MTLKNFCSKFPKDNSTSSSNNNNNNKGTKKKKNKRGVKSEEEEEEEEGEGGDTATSSSATVVVVVPTAPPPAVTLKNFCSKFPKDNSTSSSNNSNNKGTKKKKKKNKRGVKGEEEEEEEEAEKELMEAAHAAAAAAVVTQPVETTTAPTIAAAAAAPAGPQVEIINGEIVISQNSLLSHPETRTSTDQIDKEFGGTVVEDETPTQLGAINARYDSYITKPRSRPQRWTAIETKSFYKALRQCGTDFSMMQMFLEGRSRGQLKSKYKLELRKNGRLVDMALDPKSKLKLDLSVFGEGLEIPESVTPIGVVCRVSPTLVDGGAGGGSSKLEEENIAVGEVGGEGGENGGGAAAAQDAAMMECNFDHLFDDNDGEEKNVGVKEDTTTESEVLAASNSQEVTNPVVAEVAAPPPKYNAPAAVSESIPLSLAPTVKKAKSKRPRAKPKAKRATASKK